MSFCAFRTWPSVWLIANIAIAKKTEEALDANLVTLSASAGLRTAWEVILPLAPCVKPRYAPIPCHFAFARPPSNVTLNKLPDFAPNCESEANTPPRPEAALAREAKLPRG